MELSATTTMTTSNANMTTNQQDTNYVNMSSSSLINNQRPNDLLRPSNGNDNPQSLMQKQQTSITLMETSETTTTTTKARSPIFNGNYPLDNHAGQQSLVGGHKKLELVSGDDSLLSKNYIEDIDLQVKAVLDSILNAFLEEETRQPLNISSSQSSSLFVNNESLDSLTSLVAPIEEEDEEDTKPKDIVTLRNLELTPPPQPSEDVPTPEPPTINKIKKRTHSESTEQSDGPAGEARSKRQRKQTQLFQVVERKETATTSCGTPKSKTATSSKKQPKQSAKKRAPKSKSPSPQPQQAPVYTQISQIPPDVIFYEKNDYLAIRNEENTFYLCQLTENVRVEKPAIKIKWLDTRDGGKTYFLTQHYDKIPQKSIIMPIILNKLKSTKRGEQLFTLDDQVKESIMERLKRSLNFSRENEQ